MQQRPSFWSYFAAVLLFAVGLQIGMGFPDLDQSLPLLLHRSLLTHGVLLPLLLFMVLRKQPHDKEPHLALRLFAMGFCLASTVHLSFDLFPRAWRGFALIWIPFYGRASAQFSWIWIGLGCVLCLYLALLLVRHALEILLGAVGLGTTFALNYADERSVMWSLLALLIAGCIALALPSRAKSLLRELQLESR